MKTQFLEQFFQKFQLQEQDLKALSTAMKIRTLAKGALLDDFYGFAVVIKGKFKASMLSEKNAREITLFTLEKDDICLMCAEYVFQNLRVKILIQALCESEIFIIPNEQYEKILQKYPNFKHYTQSIISKRFEALIGILEQSLFVPLTQRIKNFFLQNAHKKALFITHEELANHLGSSREVISRILKQMQKRGEISQNRKEIIFLPPLFDEA